MERLTQWIGDDEDRQAIPRPDIRNNGYSKCCNKLADYEDLEEQGLLVRLPFKRGTVLYRINKGARKPIIKMVASQITVNSEAYSVKAIEEDYGEVFFSNDVIGIKVFLTREEAEKKLEEMEKNVKNNAR